MRLTVLYCNIEICLKKNKVIKFIILFCFPFLNFLNEFVSLVPICQMGSLVLSKFVALVFVLVIVAALSVRRWLL